MQGKAVLENWLAPNDVLLKSFPGELSSTNAKLRLVKEELHQTAHLLSLEKTKNAGLTVKLKHSGARLVAANESLLNLEQDRMDWESKNEKQNTEIVVMKEQHRLMKKENSSLREKHNMDNLTMIKLQEASAVKSKEYLATNHDCIQVERDLRDKVSALEAKNAELTADLELCYIKKEEAEKNVRILTSDVAEMNATNFLFKQNIGTQIVCGHMKKILHRRLLFYLKRWHHHVHSMVLSSDIIYRNEKTYQEKIQQMTCMYESKIAELNASMDINSKEMATSHRLVVDRIGVSREASVKLWARNRRKHLDRCLLASEFHKWCTAYRRRCALQISTLRAKVSQLQERMSEASDQLLERDQLMVESEKHSIAALRGQRIWSIFHQFCCMCKRRNVNKYWLRWKHHSLLVPQRILVTSLQDSLNTNMLQLSQERSQVEDLQQQCRAEGKEATAAQFHLFHYKWRYEVILVNLPQCVVIV